MQKLEDVKRVGRVMTGEFQQWIIRDHWLPPSDQCSYDQQKDLLKLGHLFDHSTTLGVLED